jgi:hypothetical protein
MFRSFILVALLVALGVQARAQTWSRVNSGLPTDAQVMAFGSNDTGFVASFPTGANIIMQNSTNGGKNFTTVVLPAAVQSGKAPAPSVSWPTPECGYFGYTVGIAPIILRTIDAGKSWKSIGAPANVILDDISFPTPLVGFAAGHVQAGDYFIYKSIDSGKIWKQVYKSNLAINRIHFKSILEGIFFLFGGGPIQVGYTFDSLHTVQKSADLTPIVSDFPKFLYWNKDNSWIAGGSGEVGMMRSADSGKIWHQVISNDPTDAGDIISACFHGRRGYAFPEHGPTVYFTQNYGASWTRGNTSSDTVDVVMSSMPTSTVAYAMGPGFSGNAEGIFLLRTELPPDPEENNNGGVALTPNGSPVSIYQDGPSIAFGMEPSAEYREIQIVDVLGRAWATVRVEPMATSAEILRSKLTPGGYFARLNDLLVKFVVW